MERSLEPLRCGHAIPIAMLAPALVETYRWRRIVRCYLWIDDQLVGIAPFFIWPSPNARTLLLIGTGISDYLDVLVDPEWKDVAANAIFSWLASEGDRWDVCDFQELRDNSLLLRAAAPDGYFDETSAQSVCPVIDLATAGYSMRRKAQRYLRHAKKLGELHIEQA